MSKYLQPKRKSRLAHLFKSLLTIILKPIRLFFLLIVLIILFIFFKLVTLPIKEISCQSQYGKCRSELEEYLETYKGKHIFAARSNINKLLLEKNIDKYIISFKFPATLEVFIQERKAIFAIKSKETIFLVDGNGEVLTVSDTTSLPIINTNYILPTDLRNINQEHLFALQLLSYLNYLYMINYGEMTGDKIEYVHPEGFKIIYPLNGDIKEIIGETRLIVNKLMSETQEFNLEKAYNEVIIDLRYQKPIIR